MGKRSKEKPGSDGKDFKSGNVKDSESSNGEASIQPRRYKTRSCKEPLEERELVQALSAISIQEGGPAASTSDCDEYQQPSTSSSHSKGTRKSVST